MASKCPRVPLSVNLLQLVSEPVVHGLRSLLGGGSDRRASASAPGRTALGRVPIRRRWFVRRGRRTV